jgi:hypothetical protein
LGSFALLLSEGVGKDFVLNRKLSPTAAWRKPY